MIDVYKRQEVGQSVISNPDKALKNGKKVEHVTKEDATAKEE